ncbi:OmpH family outer membrane protein [Hoylesella enoeca]|uniref:OmpH family outer membrane protein n=1 Tax=Hoylesella enoeca TaxID=76123 RepID=UPI00288A9896|nr:OmpH family outer membrane protein [Hoylesella enoeca]
MKKTKVIRALAVVATATVVMSSCNQSNPQMDQKSETTGSAGTTNMKIAYVEVDSIMSRYQFCKDYSQILQKKGQNIQHTLAAKQQQLQAAAANFQQKVQQNAYTREQAEAIQANLQRQSSDVQALGQRLGNEFDAETAKFNKALRDSILHFLASYNKDKKYGLILSKAGDNLLYADKVYDITDVVIAGLNKAYKPSAAIKTATATAEKKK